MADRLDRPVFFVGMPRSGTTVIFQAFSAHPDLAWFSQLHVRWPGSRAIALWSRTADLGFAFRRSVPKSTQPFTRLERLKVGPEEAYEVWERCCGRKFTYDFLLGLDATPTEAECLRRTVADVVRMQGKSRFATKITGPARIHYLDSVFPDARFVHIVRDPRAIALSLMRASFWRDTARLREPAWEGGLTDADLEEWRERGATPETLAALQWRAVIRTAREEAGELDPGRYTEIRYEDFIGDAAGSLDRLLAFNGLAPSHRPEAFMTQRFPLRDMNTQWRDQMDAEVADAITEICAEQL